MSFVYLICFHYLGKHEYKLVALNMHMFNFIRKAFKVDKKRYSDKGHEHQKKWFILHFIIGKVELYESQPVYRFLE